MAYNPDAEGWFEAHEVICAGCAAQQSGPVGGDPKKRQPGSKVYVVDGRPPELEMRPFSLGSPSDDQGVDPQR